MGEPPFTPAGENLEHNTLVAAQPNLNADGAFRLPPSIGLVDWGAQGGERGPVQFASLLLWWSVIYRHLQIVLSNRVWKCVKILSP